MCKPYAYILRNGKEVEGDEIKMVNIFGEQKILKARIRSYNNTDSKIVLEDVE